MLLNPLFAVHTAPRPKLLLIDDEASSIALLMSYLKEQAYELVVALGGHDGIRKALASQPDLILLDVRMPDVDGITVCQRLKADPRTERIPVIFLSASSDLKDKLEGFAAGGCDYIEKPFYPEEVTARVSLQLRAHDRRSTPPVQSVRATAVPASRDDRLFNQGLDLIQEHLSDPLGVDEMAHLLGTNKEKLTAVFRSRTGLSAYAYSNELRLERARHLLTNTDLRIQQISLEAGYRNSGDFSRSFRLRFGLSPRDFRRRTLTAEPTDDNRRER